MRIGISGNEGFIGTALKNVLGKDAVEISNEILTDSEQLDKTIAKLDCLIHFNGHPPESGLERDDPEAVKLMRNYGLQLTDAKKRHKGIHLILVGSLRVHPDEPTEPFYSNSTLSPRDVTAEGQLWTEERALEHASDNSPVSILRVSNVHGIHPQDGGRGFLHKFAHDATIGWIGVPGDGEGRKEMIHVEDVAGIIAMIAENPPPTRETLAIGNGWDNPIIEYANIISSEIGADVQLWDREEGEVRGLVDPYELKERMGYEAQVSPQMMIKEALEFATN